MVNGKEAKLIFDCVDKLENIQNTLEVEDSYVIYDMIKEVINKLMSMKLGDEMRDGGINKFSRKHLLLYNNCLRAERDQLLGFLKDLYYEVEDGRINRSLKMIEDEYEEFGIKEDW